MACDAWVGLRRDCSKLRKFPLVSLGGLKLSSTEGTGEGASCGEGPSDTARTSVKKQPRMATLRGMPGTATEGIPWDATDNALHCRGYIREQLACRHEYLQAMSAPTRGYCTSDAMPAEGSL